MDIVNVEKISNEKWINLFAASFRHNSHTGRWVFASRKQDPQRDAGTFDAVVIVPLLLADDQPPRLVMVREFRVPVGDWIHGFPAGLVEAGESLEEAVRRELREETGLEVLTVKKVTPQLYSSSGLTDESAVLVFVDARATAGGVQHLEGCEEIEVLLLDYPAVCRLCEAPGRVDAKAWMVLYLYQQLGRLE